MRIESLLAYFRGPAEGADKAFRLDIAERFAQGHFAGLQLRSVFQPLFATTTLQPEAYEALLRVFDSANAPQPIERVFMQAGTPAEIARLDRLCRVLHAINFAQQSNSRTSLFLNVDGRHLSSVDIGELGSTFERLLEHCNLRPTQVVLEIVESRIDNLKLLQDALQVYQQRGYRVAIDDFGCEHSNFDRLWLLAPDIVKLDRELIVQAVANQRARTILPKLVEIIHDLGAQVVCEGIETPEQHAIAADAGADLLQGFYFARPASELVRQRTNESSLRPGAPNEITTLQSPLQLP